MFAGLHPSASFIMQVFHHILLHAKYRNFVICCDDGCERHLTSLVRLLEIYLAVSGKYHSHFIVSGAKWRSFHFGVIFGVVTQRHAACSYVIFLRRSGPQ